MPRARATALVCSAYSASVTDALVVDGFELAGGGGGVDLCGRNRALGQDRHDVVADLGKAAVDEVAVDLGRRPWSAARRSRAGRSRAPGRA